MIWLQHIQLCAPWGKYVHNISFRHTSAYIGEKKTGIFIRNPTKNISKSDHKIKHLFFSLVWPLSPLISQKHMKQLKSDWKLQAGIFIMNPMKKIILKIGPKIKKFCLAQFRTPLTPKWISLPCKNKIKTEFQKEHIYIWIIKNFIYQFWYNSMPFPLFRSLFSKGLSKNIQKL